jgi:hypothetical protein
MKIKAIVTGVTGMVGEGVLHECLHDPDVESILILGRKASGISHPKVREILHRNFLDVSSIENDLKGYNTCFFCLGVSSVGMKEEEYYRLTYDLTMEVAETLARLNPETTFCYVSGAGTDSCENGRIMWARVKGKTENRLLQLFPGKAYMFRPGYMHPTTGLKNTQKSYRYLSWLYPLLRLVFPKFVSTLQEQARAMVNAAKYGYKQTILEVKDIKELAARK